MWHALLEVLFPPACASCGARRSEGDPAPFCGPCGESVDPLRAPCCTVCGEPFEAEGPSHPCARCLRRPPAFEIARAPYRYGGALLEAVHRYKYRGAWTLGRELAALLERPLPDLAGRGFDRVVPVPLHPRRLAERGFDQTLPLARAVSRAHRAPLLPRALRRLRYTPPQARLRGRARIENVQGAFAVPRPIEVVGRRVLLVDDVLTTGATALACARALIAAGAARVGVVTLARTA